MYFMCFHKLFFQIYIGLKISKIKGWGEKTVNFFKRVRHLIGLNISYVENPYIHRKQFVTDK